MQRNPFSLMSTRKALKRWPTVIPTLESEAFISTQSISVIRQQRQNETYTKTKQSAENKQSRSDKPLIRKGPKLHFQLVVVTQKRMAATHFNQERVIKQEKFTALMHFSVLLNRVCVLK
jgi:hypothetical protein